MSDPEAPDTVLIRPARDSDLVQIVALISMSLGWDDSPTHREFFTWKHEQSPFGASVSWVAEAGDELVGFRTFMRWTFRRHGAPVLAVRAVDTATRPDFRGQGIFRRLTLHAVQEMRAAGVGIVFNTPNEQSRPGYLSMGWRQVGRIPVSVRFAGPGGVRRALGARVAAERWGVPTDVGVDAGLYFVQQPRLWTARPRDGDALSTDRPAEFLQWRYGFGPLGYRVLADERAALVFRLRQRGTAVELTVADAVGGPRHVGRLVRSALKSTSADYALTAGWSTPGMVPLPRQGPVLTARDLTLAPPQSIWSWRLCLGDVELF